MSKVTSTFFAMVAAGLLIFAVCGCCNCNDCGCCNCNDACPNDVSIEVDES